MFAKTIVTSDAFLDMPPTARCLYFTLGMFADDDGFVNNPKSIMRQVGASSDDMNILIAKKFVIAFESGVIVIKHWRIHNYIQSDRYHPTKYQEEMNLLEVDENKAYTMVGNDVYTPRIQGGYKVDTEDKRSKDKLIKDNNNRSKMNDEFDLLWDMYPRKEGKKSALKAYEKARKSGTTYEEVETGIRLYLCYIEDNKIERRFIKMGSTWFNQNSWTDQYVNDEQDDLMKGIV
jgi:hypothetical protein